MNKNFTTIKEEVLDALERRKRLIQSKCVPFENDIIKSHGDCFGNILKNQLTPNATYLMDLDKEHKMPNTNLWIPPDNLDKKKVCVTNATHYDKIKATSHRGILNLGEVIEKKFQRKHTYELKNALNENSEFERFECQERIKFALQAQQNFYKEKIRKLTEKFNEEFRYQKDTLQCHYQKKCNKYIKKTIGDCYYNIKDALATEKNKYICTCRKPTKNKRIKKVQKKNKCILTSALNFKKSKPNYIEENHVFNNKKLCNMMHFILCGERLEYLKLMKNVKKKYANELINIKLNLSKISEDIMCDISASQTKVQVCPQKRIKDTNAIENFDTLCCIRKKFNNILMCLEKRIESLELGEEINKFNTCAVIVPRNTIHENFCTCVSSSLDTSTIKSTSTDGFDFADFITPNVNWDFDKSKNSTDIVCKCRKKKNRSDSSSSSARSIKISCVASDINTDVVSVVNLANPCSSSASSY